jgi:hypothetical protein
MRTRVAAVLLLGVVVAGTIAWAKGVGLHPRGPAPRPPLELARTDGPRIQLAILLDTSNSMDGLIDQTRSQLWSIVNQFATARRAGRGAQLEVALYEYGNSGLSPSSGWVRRVLGFTRDLDRVSEELFALRTNGGEEYCGTVIKDALDELAWSDSASDLRVIFIAGNEPFTQGPVDFRPVCRRAAQMGITVNTIHCGPYDEGAASGWKTGALMAGGAYNAIDQSQVMAHIDAPQDAEIARLGTALNQTYLPYGAAGHEGALRQEAQDANASRSAKGSYLGRVLTKSNRMYSNSSWDLVDATKNEKLDVATLKEEELPAEMQKLPLEKKKEYIAAKDAERQRLQAEIGRLNAAREAFVATARAKSGVAEKSTLEAAVAKVLREQAAGRGIELQ